MTDKKYTPGPWHTASINGENIVRNAEHLNIARINGTMWGSKNPTEDARLIAAAPELVEALEAVDEWGDLIKQNYPEMLFVDKVRAALAKALGE